VPPIYPHQSRLVPRHLLRPHQWQQGYQHYRHHHHLAETHHRINL
jgi:hypothetical protein